MRQNDDEYIRAPPVAAAAAESYMTMNYIKRLLLLLPDERCNPVTQRQTADRRQRHGSTFPLLLFDLDVAATNVVVVAPIPHHNHLQTTTQKHLKLTREKDLHTLTQTNTQFITRTYRTI